MKILKYSLVSLFILLGVNLNAQIPTEVPKPQDNSPVDFSEPVNIILFIILPLAVVVLVIIWRNKRQKDETVQK
ncbi:hypothetical protein EI546_02730 [Aequorivita sp. H23M31]|uniref:Adenylosuccinate synthetase n=1 Tax=Aequorivita ciconiae TaxID=2494375 RepID=A0A410G0A9_9FLAO|nr:hypothetical protein [Aequorivita sp. H23M31]QAA80707.1 hypothetical protein EI546_02730 [Aequorivita sp. H23M31]